jgi:hypothetical protein
VEGEPRIATNWISLQIHSKSQERPGAAKVDFESAGLECVDQQLGFRSALCPQASRLQFAAQAKDLSSQERLTGKFRYRRKWVSVVDTTSASMAAQYLEQLVLALSNEVKSGGRAC